MGMKKTFSTIGIVVAIALLTCMASSAAADSTGVTITLLNPPPDDLLVLEIGESYTFEIEITSEAQFILAMAMPDIYYPGRAVIWHAPDLAKHTKSATLYLTMTGKGPTAEFAEVYDWPEPDDYWPDGVVPASIVVGVRFKEGVVVSERFDFAVVVP
jgi:hypothetical protein